MVDTRCPSCGHSGHDVAQIQHRARYLHMVEGILHGNDVCGLGEHDWNYCEYTMYAESIMAEAETKGFTNVESVFDFMFEHYEDTFVDGAIESLAQTIWNVVRLVKED